MRVVDGRGKIVPDAFAEIRLVNLPPAVSTVRTFPFFRTQMAPPMNIRLLPVLEHVHFLYLRF
jgi:hypothetical protein